MIFRWGYLWTLDSFLLLFFSVLSDVENLSELGLRYVIVCSILRDFFGMDEIVYERSHILVHRVLGTLERFLLEILGDQYFSGRFFIHLRSFLKWIRIGNATISRASHWTRVIIELKSN
jgi:hypothetical protein